MQIGIEDGIVHLLDNGNPLARCERMPHVQGALPPPDLPPQKVQLPRQRRSDRMPGVQGVDEV